MPSVNPRSKWLPWFTLCTTALIASCGKSEESGGLMLMIDQDGSLMIDELRVRVFDEKGKTLASNEYPVTDGDLPATLGLSNKKEGATVSVRVSAWRQEVPLDVRDLVIENVPTDTTKAVKIILGASCGPRVSVEDGEAVSSCSAGETCDPTTGECEDGTRDARDLGEYHDRLEEGLVPGDAGDGDGDSGSGGMAGDGDGDGDGDSSTGGVSGDGDGDDGSGGRSEGSGGETTSTGGAGTGGAGTGGPGTGGGAGTGGAGTGGSGTGSSGTGGDAGEGCSAVITEWIDNHDAPGKHDYDGMEVSAADVDAGVEKTYLVQGTSLHSHTLTVTAQDFADLVADGMIEVTTSIDNSHDHTVRLTCSM